MARQLSLASSSFLGLVADGIATTPFAGALIRRAQDAVEDRGGHTAEGAALQAGVVLDADTGQRGHLRPSQAGDPPFTPARQPHLARRQLGPTRDEELTDLRPPVHAATVGPGASELGCPERARLRGASQLGLSISRSYGCPTPAGPGACAHSTCRATMSEARSLLATPTARWNATQPACCSGLGAAIRLYTTRSVAAIKVVATRRLRALNGTEKQPGNDWGTSLGRRENAAPYSWRPSNRPSH